MCPFVSADVRGGGRLRGEPKECLRRRLFNNRIVTQLCQGTVTYHVMKKTSTCLPIVGQFFDTIIVASSDKEWLQ